MLIYLLRPSATLLQKNLSCIRSASSFYHPPCWNPSSSIVLINIHPTSTRTLIITDGATHARPHTDKQDDLTILIKPTNFIHKPNRANQEWRMPCQKWHNPAFEGHRGSRTTAAATAADAIWWHGAKNVGHPKAARTSQAERGAETLLTIKLAYKYYFNFFGSILHQPTPRAVCLNTPWSSYEPPLNPPVTRHSIHNLQ